MSSQQACPTPLQIQNWANGRHTPSEAEWLASHLERCEACARRFAAIPNDEPLSRLVRQIGSELESEGDDHPSVRSLIEQLCQVAMPGEHWGAEEPEDLLEPPAEPDEIGRLGGYRILERIGMGGMGVVFRAEDTKLSRPVALKILRPHLLHSDATRSRFLSEARTAASLKHDHIVVIYQVGEVVRAGESTVPFIAMEFLEGSSLTDWLRRNLRPPLDVVVQFGREIASGLAAAHSRGIVHRDIKPGNIWVETVSDSGAAREPLPAGAVSLTRIRLLDFGLACTESEHQASVAGTPGYMAPEQSRGEAIDHRADLFALGRVLSEMLNGRPPKSPPAGEADTPQARRESPAVSRQLHRLIRKLLVPNPAGRPPSARAVEEQLRSLEVQLARRPTFRWVLVGGALLAVAFAAAFWFWGRDGSVEVAGDRAVVIRRGPDEVARLTAENGWRSKLPPGHYTAEADGLEATVDPPHFTIRSGDSQRLTVLAAPSGPVGDEWLKYVAGLPADRQVNAVLAKLVELNPGFAGKCEFWAVQDGRITEFRVVTDSIRDISPVKGLPNLRVLACFGSKRGKGQLADLSPLQGMDLKALNCWHNPLSDLSPLRGMRLTEFQAEGTQIDSLAELADMPIRTLTVQNTKVKDLSTVRNMPLWLCYVNGCPLSSLEPLASTPVELLCCDYRPERDRQVLKSMPKLANINRLPAERFWREVELGRVPIP